MSSPNWYGMSSAEMIELSSQSFVPVITSRSASSIMASSSFPFFLRHWKFMFNILLLDKTGVSVWLLLWGDALLLCPTGELSNSKLVSFSACLKPGPSCSKLTMSLVNDSLKFTLSDTQIC